MERRPPFLLLREDDEKPDEEDDEKPDEEDDEDLYSSIPRVRLNSFTIRCWLFLFGYLALKYLLSVGFPVFQYLYIV
jgi:hypothetical protein